MRAEHIVYFDIDKTIINTPEIKNGFVAALAQELGISETAIADLVTAYTTPLESSTDFDPEALAQHIVENLLAKQATSEKLLQLIFDVIAPVVVFEEVVQVLEILARMPDVRLGIFSEGVREWQEVKLKNSGLDVHFANEKLRGIYTRKLLSEVIAGLRPNSVVVDDKKQVVNAIAAQRLDVTAVWINRGDREPEAALHASVLVITSLRELPDLANELWSEYPD